MNFYDNSANWSALESLQNDFDVVNELITESLKKKQKKTVTFHTEYTPPV